MSMLDVFEEMGVTFSGKPDALFRLGNRAFEIGAIKLEKAAYMKVAIKAYEEALKIYTKEDFPEVYPIIAHNHRKLLEFCRGE